MRNETNKTNVTNSPEAIFYAAKGAFNILSTRRHLSQKPLKLRFCVELVGLLKYAPVLVPSIGDKVDTIYGLWHDAGCNKQQKCKINEHIGKADGVDL